MRGRSIRLSIIIALILAVSIVSLAFREIHLRIPAVFQFDRAESGPLGLKLGLDLRGGGNLVYQAKTGTRIDATFNREVNELLLQNALDQLAIGELTVTQETSTAFRVEAPLLNSEQRQAVIQALSEVEQFIIEVDFVEPYEDLSRISEEAQALELPDFSVGRLRDDAVLIRTSALDDEQSQGLQDALAEVVGEVESFEVTKLALLSSEVTNAEPPTADQMAGVLEIINRRVNLFGTEEPIIQRFGTDRVIVQLPGASGSVTDVTFADSAARADVAAALRETALEDFSIEQLEPGKFKIRTVFLDPDRRGELESNLTERVGEVLSFQVTGGIEEAKALIGQTAQLEFKERTCTDQACIGFTDADLNLTGDDLANAFASPNPNTGQWEINIQFDSRGSEIFSDLTQRIVDIQTKRIAIFLDDDLLLAPVASAWIRNGRSVITSPGGFPREEAQTLAIQLESGRLPVPLELIQESDVDALLGSRSLQQSLIAGLVGLGLVLVFMVAYYRMAGVVAAVALVFYSLVVLAFFKLIPITLTLPHIGGFILSIGFAVDANILIFERMKEEMRIGRTLASSMEVGFSRAWPAIRDSNVSTLITCGVLLWFGSRLGGGLVTGFALSLLIGVSVSMFTAVVVSRNLLQVLAWVGLGRRVSLFTPEPVQRPAQAAGRLSTTNGGK